jgi:ABC-type Fe3+-hydroxamate transport system substrate-binding protein
MSLVLLLLAHVLSLLCVQQAQGAAQAGLTVVCARPCAISQALGRTCVGDVAQAVAAAAPHSGVLVLAEPQAQRLLEQLMTNDPIFANRAAAEELQAALKTEAEASPK